MQSDIRKSEKGNRTAYLNVGIWYDQNSDQIRLTLPHSKWFHTTVARNPSGRRGHPNLFAKLARALKEAGVPYPEVEEVDDAGRT